jgi:hypothetical protein
MRAQAIFDEIVPVRARLPFIATNCRWCLVHSVHTNQQSGAMRPSPASRCPSAPLRYLLHNMDTFIPSYAHIGQSVLQDVTSPSFRRDPSRVSWNSMWAWHTALLQERCELLLTICNIVNRQANKQASKVVPSTTPPCLFCQLFLVPLVSAIQSTSCFGSSSVISGGGGVM